MEVFARVPMEVNVNKMEDVFVEKDLVESLVQFVGFFSNFNLIRIRIRACEKYAAFSLLVSLSVVFTVNFF